MNINADAARGTDKLYTGPVMTILTIPIGGYGMQQWK
jgi:hypothetical protein